MVVSEAGGSRAMPASTLSGDEGVTMEVLSGATAEQAAEMDESPTRNPIVALEPAL
jgi:hypothetical protein